MSEQQEEIKLDFSGLGLAIKEGLKEQNAQYAKAIKEALQKDTTPNFLKDPLVYRMPSSKAEKILESLHTVGNEGWKMQEQWTVAIPNYRVNEPKAHLRDYVWTQEVLKTEQGDVLNIPYVQDFYFEQLSSVGSAFSATIAEASLIGYVTTTLYEAGKYTDLSYYLLEKFDSNLLDLLNTAFADAAVRSEDKKIMSLINALTATNYAGAVNTSGAGNKLVTASKYFYSTNISSALALLLNMGKDVKPQDCLLYLTPAAYGALVTEIVASQVIAFAAPQIITQGVIEALFGVKIVVGAYKPVKPRTAASTGTVDICFMMRSKRSVCLAPKRDILIETQKQVATRKLRIVASHTFGIKILDAKEIVRIWTSKTELGTTSA
jgi:hypothetical protein